MTNSVDTSSTPPADIAVLKVQLQKLQELHTTGVMSSDAYAEEKSQLEMRILDLVLTEKPVTQPSLRLMAMLSSVVVVVAGIGYTLMSNTSPKEAEATASAPMSEVRSPGVGAQEGSPHATNFDQISEMTERLAAKLQAKPQDADGWAMLARSYSVLGNNPEALKAYEKAVFIRGDDAILLADFAEALAIKNSNLLAGEPMKLVERALKIDPRNLKAMSLAGSHAFEVKNYAGAVKFWNQVVQFGAADVNLLEDIQPRLADARKRAGFSPVSKSTPEPMNPVNAIDMNTLSGTITLAPALLASANPQDTVFIFARNAEGSRMPLAIVRMQVKDLPIQFTLDDSMAMSPNAKLSQASGVIVGVRISKSGTALPEKGDLSGQSGVVTLGAKGLSIEIKDVVKQ